MKDCYGKDQPNKECESCNDKTICEYVKEKFVPKEALKLALNKITKIETIMRGE